MAAVQEREHTKNWIRRQEHEKRPIRKKERENHQFPFYFFKKPCFEYATAIFKNICISKCVCVYSWNRNSVRTWILEQNARRSSSFISEEQARPGQSKKRMTGR